jgi:hypothetical protein
MKKTLLALILSAGWLCGSAQTAVNFNCNDCAGNPHDLYTELDAGKVIVLDFVMPCGACVAPSLTAYNIVQSYAVSHPGRVKFYLSDDFGTTPCFSVSTWSTNSSMPNPDAVFSNTSLYESMYGPNGMPKILVIGGTNHTIYYEGNGALAGDPTGIQNAIDAALLATGIPAQGISFASLNIFPNPSGNTSALTFNLNKLTDIKIELLNAQGQKVFEVFSGLMPLGENRIEISTAVLSRGIYFVKVSGEGKTRMLKLLVADR